MFRTQAVWIQKLREGCSTLMQWFIPAGSLHLVLNPALIHITGISTHWSLHVVFLHIKFPSPQVIICIGYLPLLGWWCCSMKTLRLIVLVLQRSLETKQLWRIMQGRCSENRMFCCPVTGTTRNHRYCPWCCLHLSPDVSNLHNKRGSTDNLHRDLPHLIL